MWSLIHLGPSSLKSSTLVVVSGSTALSARQDVALRRGGLMLAAASDSNSNYLKVTSLSTLGQELIAAPWFPLMKLTLAAEPAEGNGPSLEVLINSREDRGKLRSHVWGWYILDQT